MPRSRPGIDILWYPDDIETAMVIIAKIKLTSLILGENPPDNSGIRRLKKRSGAIAVDTKQWMGQVRAACGVLGYKINEDALLLPDTYTTPRIELHRRIYSGAKVELFESIRKGAELTVEFATREDLPECPTLEHVREILTAIGKHFGLSQWGSKFGFGRFKLIQCCDKSSLPSNPTPDLDLG